MVNTANNITERVEGNQLNGMNHRTAYTLPNINQAASELSSFIVVVLMASFTKELNEGILLFSNHLVVIEETEHELQEHCIQKQPR